MPYKQLSRNLRSETAYISPRARVRGLIFLLVIAIFTILSMLAQPSAGIASATAVVEDPTDLDFTMPGYREVYSRKNTLAVGSAPMLGYELAKAENEFSEFYSAFEYVLKIEIDFDRSTFDNIFNFYVQFNNTQYTEDMPPFEFDIRAINNKLDPSYETLYSAISWGYYNPNGLANVHETEKLTTSKIYLRATSAEISAIFVWDPIQQGFDEAKPYQTISFTSDTKQYADLLRFFRSEKTILSNADVTYEINEGTSIPAYLTINLTESFKLFAERTVQLPEEPTREGYTFDGWYYDEACTRPYDGAELAEDTVLYPGWKINRYHVYFDVIENASGTVYETDVDYNTPVTCPTDPDLGGKYTHWAFEDGTLYTGQGITSDTHLYAVWIVNFNVNGGDPLDSITVRAGESIETVPTATREGYSFVAWAYRDGVDVYYNGEPITEDTTLHAVWKDVILRVTFYMGENIYRQINVGYGTTLISACAQARVSADLVVSFSFENLQTPTVAIKDAVLKDNAGVVLKRVDNTPTPDLTDKITETAKNFKTYLEQNLWAQIVLGIVCATVVAMIVACITIAVKRKR